MIFEKWAYGPEILHSRSSRGAQHIDTKKDFLKIFRLRNTAIFEISNDYQLSPSIFTRVPPKDARFNSEFKQMKILAALSFITGSRPF